MFTKDTLSQLKQLKQDIKASRNLAIGTVKGTANKFGFVTVDGGKDVYLSPEEMLKVLHGDQVEIEIKKNDKNKAYGEIQRVVESPTKTFFGSIVAKGKAIFVDPDLPGISRWIFIPPNKRAGAQEGDLVACKLSQHPFKTGKPQATVFNKIGHINEPGIERLYTLNKYHINVSQSTSVIKEAETITEDIIQSLCAERADESDVPFITIDAKSTRDMDDALWAEETDQGWILKIAIADPASALDGCPAIEKTIIHRAASVYLPGQTIPMLPESISSDLCSLVPDKLRLAKLLTLEVLTSGEVSSILVSQAAIKNHQKLSYAEVSEALESQDDSTQIKNKAIARSILNLHAVSEALNQFRQNHHLVPTYRKEFILELDEGQKILAIKPKVQTKANKIVEECMVAANKEMAKWLAGHEVKSLYVSQPGVRLDRQDAIQRTITNNINEQLVDLSNLESFADFIKTFSKSEDSKDAYLAKIVSKQLERSKPSTTPLPHFGLGLSMYLTFTSPLRKASDYLIHKQVNQLLNGKPVSPIEDDIAESLEAQQQAVRSCAYENEQWLKCQFITQLANQSLPANIQRVISSGFFIRLSEYGIEGFVTTKDMEGKYSFNPDLLTLKGKTAQYQLDQSVNVIFKEVDWGRKQIHFSITNQ